ncbi:MAG: hypothetical protein J0L92_04985 [Deltaproteobacteria bacterium]|nr:hypothetical protein [Deltaproteobacteria bacterium]
MSDDLDATRLVDELLDHGCTVRAPLGVQGVPHDRLEVAADVVAEIRQDEEHRTHLPELPWGGRA